MKITLLFQRTRSWRVRARLDQLQHSRFRNSTRESLLHDVSKHDASAREPFLTDVRVAEKYSTGGRLTPDVDRVEADV